MFSKKSLWAATFFAVCTSTSFAQQCYFDKKIGTCTGKVRILSTTGSTGSHNAEIAIVSSTGACSKVEYYIHSTPQTAIIRSSGIEHESVFGSKPLTESDIEVIQCTAYAGGGAEAGITPEQRARYGRCATDTRMVSELDEQYSDIGAMIRSATLAAMKEMQDYFADDNQDNPRWIRRQQILSQCL